MVRKRHYTTLPHILPNTKNLSKSARALDTRFINPHFGANVVKAIISREVTKLRGRFRGIGGSAGDVGGMVVFDNVEFDEGGCGPAIDRQVGVAVGVVVGCEVYDSVSMSI